MGLTPLRIWSHTHLTTVCTSQNDYYYFDVWLGGWNVQTHSGSLSHSLTHTHTHTKERQGVILRYLTIDTNPHILNGGLRTRRMISFLFHSFPPFYWFRILASFLFFFFNSPVNLFKPRCVSLSLFLPSLLGFIVLYLSPISFLLFSFFHLSWLLSLKGCEFAQWESDTINERGTHITHSHTHIRVAGTAELALKFTHTLTSPLSLSFTYYTHSEGL